MTTFSMRPKRLFRYFPQKAAPAFLPSGDFRLYFSKVSAFNDPFEITPRYDRRVAGLMDNAGTETLAIMQSNGFKVGRKEMYVLKHLNRQASSTQLQKMREADRRDFDEVFRVLCFSAQPHSLLMWSHYADQHRGFTVEFDPRHAAFCSAANSDSLAAIDPDKPPLCRKVFDRVKYRTRRLFCDTNNIRGLLFGKSREWNYEKEYRMVWRLDELTPGKLNGTEHYYIDLPGDSVRAVFLGCRMLEKKKKKIAHLKWFTRWPNKLYFMELHPSDYALTPVPWSEHKTTQAPHE